MKDLRVAIIGAGAAGMMAAGTLREAGITPDVYERSDSPGKKLRITGKGRCNLTNDCAPDEMINNVPTNPRFLYGALNSFTSADLKALVESLGVPLKTERGNRVFPVSDSAADVVNAFRRYMGVDPIFERVRSVTRADGGFAVATRSSSRVYDRVIIATGGLSYPRTGSTGDGFDFARALGHTVTDFYPSLIPLTCAGGDCARMMGLSLRNVGVRVVEVATGKTVYEDFGEMMFTHFGITGPVVLSASSHLRRVTPGKWRFDVDLKPALDRETLDRRVLSDFGANRNRDFSNSLGGLLPRAMIDVFIDRCGIDRAKKVNSITREERDRVVDTLKCFSLDLTGTRPIEEAIITSGGVSVKEIDPKTMESKTAPGLYFAGEIIDVDAYTGGFNLQIAFSTGRCAARAIIRSAEE